MNIEQSVSYPGQENICIPMSLLAQIQWFQVLNTFLHPPENIYLNQTRLRERQILIRILQREKKILYQLLPHTLKHIIS